MSMRNSGGGFRWRLAALGTLLVLSGGGPGRAGDSPGREPVGDGPGTAPGAGAKIVFVVRHAEKSSDDPRDPRLSRTGVERASALAAMLAHAGVTHLYSSEFRRTHETLEPLAERCGREIEVIPAGTPDAQVTAIHELPAGSVAVVAGHSNTVPELVRALGGEVSRLVDTPHGPMLDDNSYDRMFQVIMPAPEDGDGSAGVRTVEFKVGG